MKKILLTTFVITMFYGCQTSNNNENLEQIDKKAAREVVLSTKTVGDSILHITKQKIWENDIVVNEKIDTIITVKQWSSSDSVSTPIYVTIQ